MSAPTDSAKGRTRRSNASPRKLSPRVAPPSCRCWAMDQAKLRSLATPKINAFLPSNGLFAIFDMDLPLETYNAIEGYNQYGTHCTEIWRNIGWNSGKDTPCCSVGVRQSG